MAIEKDRITPQFIEAYKKWWEGVVERYSFGQESGFLVSAPQKKKSLYMSQLDVVIKKIHSDFSKDFPDYKVDVGTFRCAYLHHPLGWKLFLGDGSEISKIYYEDMFKEISKRG